MQSTSSRLEKFRHEANLSVADMAHALAVDQATIIAMERSVHLELSTSQPPVAASDGLGAMLPDVDRWASTLALVSIALCVPAESLCRSDVNPHSTGFLVRSIRGTRSVDDVLANCDGLSRDEFGKIEVGNTPLEIIGPRLLAWAKACNVPLATFIF